VPAWVQIELDTTPPEEVESPTSTLEVGAIYIADIGFDENLSQSSNIYIQQGEDVVENETLEIDEANMRAVFDASRLSLGPATLHVVAIDDVLNTKNIEYALMAIEGSAFLLELPERDWQLDLPARDWEFNLPELDIE
jgi:hypothetical protein